MLKRTLTACVPLALVALAGCGSSGPSLSEFKKGYQADKAQFTALGSDLQKALTGAPGKSDAQLETQFSSFSQRVNQVADQLQKLKPPAKYKSQLDRLIGGLRTIAKDLEAISLDARSGNAAAARAGTTKLIADAMQVRAVDDSLSAALGLPRTG